MFELCRIESEPLKPQFLPVPLIVQVVFYHVPWNLWNHWHGVSTYIPH